MMVWHGMLCEKTYQLTSQGLADLLLPRGKESVSPRCEDSVTIVLALSGCEHSYCKGYRDYLESPVFIPLYGVSSV